MKIRTLALANLKYNKKNYAMYFFAMCFCIFTTYSFLGLLFSDTVAEKVAYSDNYRVMLMSFGVVILVFVLFFLLSSNKSFIRARKKELSTYALFGMSTSKIGQMLLYETMVMGLLALTVGIVFGIFFSKLMVMLLLKLLVSSSNGAISFMIEPIAILITVLIYTVMFLLMGMSGLRVVNKFQLVELFRADKETENKNNGSYVILVLSLFLIVAGYIAATSSEPGFVLLAMIPILIIVILGTYLFFFSGLSKVLYLKKRNKTRYYTKKHMISLALLSYKVKTMASTMATIAILVAVGTTAIAFGYTLYQNAGAQTYESNNFDLYYYSGNSSLLSDVEGILSEYGQSVTDVVQFSGYLSKPIFDVPSEYEYSYHDPYFITYSESSYNRIVDAAKSYNQQVSVAEGEALLIYSYDQGDITDATASIQYGESVFPAAMNNTNHVFNYGGDAPVGIVLNDKDFNRLRAKGYIATSFPDREALTQVVGINYTDPMSSGDSADELSVLLSAKTNAYRISYYGYHELLSIFGILCFIGFFMCAIFILMTASMLYFRQISIATQEKVQYETLRKIGLTNEEENQIVRKRLLPIFFLPLILGILHSVFAMKGADTMIFSNMIIVRNLPNTYLSVLKTSAVMYVAYSLVYLLFYWLTKAQYKQTIRS